MDSMDRTVNKHVTTNVMVVTTSMVLVIEDVHRAGWDTTVNNVMYLHTQHKFLHKSSLNVVYLFNTKTQ